MKKVLLLLTLPLVSLANEKDKDPWDNYVTKKVDSLRKLPNSKVYLSEEKTTVVYYDTVDKNYKTESFLKGSCVIPKKVANK